MHTAFHYSWAASLVWMIGVFAVLSSPFCFHHVGISLLINNYGKKKGIHYLIITSISTWFFRWYKSPGGIFWKVDTNGWTTNERWGSSLWLLSPLSIECDGHLAFTGHCKYRKQTFIGNRNVASSNFPFWKERWRIVLVGQKQNGECSDMSDV